MAGAEQILRLRVYVGEDKRHGEEALFTAILRKAHEIPCAGATLYRGLAGFGRDGRLRTYDVLASEDLPVVIELIDRAPVIQALRGLLQGVAGIGLITCEPVDASWPEPAAPDKQA